MKLRNKLAISVATASLAMAGVLVTSQAVGDSKLVVHSNAERIAEAATRKVDRMQDQMRQMARMMASMQAELARVKAANSSAKVQELDAWLAEQKAKPEDTADSTFMVRGGWAHFNNNRGDSVAGLGTGYGEDLLTSEVDQDAFYYGGAFSHNINNDLFGLMDHTSFQIEFGIEYTELGDREKNGLNPALDALFGMNVDLSDIQETVTVNMLRVSAAPKIKFMHGSKLRPWIIPLGIDFNIISPPSDAITVLNTGMLFGAGVDYDLYRGISVGIDGRYHWTPDDVDGVDTDGFQLGGSIGFAF